MAAALWSTQTWLIFMNLLPVFLYLFQFAINSQRLKEYWSSLRFSGPGVVAACLTLCLGFPTNFQHLLFLKPVSIALIDFVDYGCNQRWPFQRSQQISLHTFHPTHTPPHTLFLCFYIKYICAMGLRESLFYMSKIFSWAYLYWPRGAKVMNMQPFRSGNCCCVWNTSPWFTVFMTDMTNACRSIVWAQLTTSKQAIVQNVSFTLAWWRRYVSKIERIPACLPAWSSDVSS